MESGKKASHFFRQRGNRSRQRRQDFAVFRASGKSHPHCPLGRKDLHPFSAFIAAIRAFHCLGQTAHLFKINDAEKFLPVLRRQDTRHTYTADQLDFSRPRFHANGAVFGAVFPFKHSPMDCENSIQIIVQKNPRNAVIAAGRPKAAAGRTVGRHWIVSKAVWRRTRAQRR